MDLLTVLGHELGHVLGLEHAEEGVMAETLDASTRQVPNTKLTINLRPTDLPDALSLACGNTIWRDANAAGWGWFVDRTPRNDSEFRKPGNQGEKHRMDLLTALAHEVGHLLGFDHEPTGVMADTLATATLTFAPGETTKTITIEVKCDNKKEANETFYLDLFGNSSNSLFTKNRGLGTILNDD